MAPEAQPPTCCLLTRHFHYTTSKQLATALFSHTLQLVFIYAWKSSAGFIFEFITVTAELLLKVGLSLMCFINLIEVSDIYASTLHHTSPAHNKSATLHTRGCNHNEIANLQFLHGAVMHTF